MKTFGISVKTYSLICRTLSLYKGIEEVLIFGSRAKGTDKKGSDIDLAIKGLQCTSLLAMELQGKCNETLPIPYKVDIVDYNSVTDTHLKEHIDRTGLLFYQKTRN